MERKSFLSKVALAAGSIPILSLFLKDQVSASVIDNAPISAQDVKYKNTTVDTSLTALDDRLSDVEEGIGLETRCIIKSLLMFNFQGNIMCAHEDGTFRYGLNFADVLEGSTCFSTTSTNTNVGYGYSVPITLLKDGYYAITKNNSTEPPALYPAGSVINVSLQGPYTACYYQVAIAYCGTSVPG